jgi:hypothetical protein
MGQLNFFDHIDGCILFAKQMLDRAAVVAHEATAAHKGMGEELAGRRSLIRVLVETLAQKIVKTLGPSLGFAQSGRFGFAYLHHDPGGIEFVVGRLFFRQLNTRYA